MIFMTQNRLFVFVTLIFLISGCHLFKNETPAEEKLLNVFKNEIPILEEFQNDYTGYMTHQIDRFNKTQKKTVGFIQEINEKFEDMSEYKKIDYQKKWQIQFQPVIKKIEELTKTMIANQTASLDPKNMATIEELSLKIKEMEKSFNDVKLKPQFYR